MCCSTCIFPTLGVNNIYIISFINQRLVFCLEEIITFFAPGIIWLYYGLNTINCRSPVDEIIPLMVRFYFAIPFLLFIIMFNTSIKTYDCFTFIKFLMFLYLIGKITILILMLVYVQTKYYQDWEFNTCEHIKSLTLTWLIWNYIMVCVSFIFFIVYIGSACCDDEYDEYDDENDEVCICC